MTDSTLSTLVQLQYCPICRHLIRPSLMHSGEAVVKEGVYYHATCLSKGERASGRSAPASVDFDNEEGTSTDFQNYDKVVVESISAMRTQRAPRGIGPTGGGAAAPAGAGNGTGGTGQYSAVRRKTTSSAASAIASPRGDDPPAARRSSMVLRSYSEPRSKKSPAPLIGVMAGVVLLIIVGAYFLLSVGPTPGTTGGSGTDLASHTPPKPPDHSVTQPPVNSSTPGHTVDPVAPAPPTIPPGEKEPTPYELAHREPAPQTVPQPAQAAAYEPAGPTVAWLVGNTLGEWKVDKSVPGAVTVADGVMAINPQSDPVVVEHLLPAPDYDLSFDLRFGDGERGVYAEFWTPTGLAKLTSADFQSTQWTPVTVEVRGGKLTCRHGTQGPDKVHPAFTDTTNSVFGDRSNFMGSRQVVMFFLGTTATKDIRNIQYTPMRPVAPAPPTVPVVQPPTGKALPLPLTLLTNNIEQPLGRWERVQVQTEGDKSFVTWNVQVTGKQTADFAPTDIHQILPAVVHVRLEYRLRKTAARVMTFRFWLYGKENRTTTFNAPSADSWQVAEFDLNGIPNELGQIEIRISEDPGAEALLDIGSVTLTVPDSATSPAPGLLVLPPGQPEPAVPTVPAVPRRATLLALTAKALATPAGVWKQMEQKTEDGQTFLHWAANSGASAKVQYPYFKIYTPGTTPPKAVKVRLKYRANNYTGQHLVVRLYEAGTTTYLEGLLPVGTQGAWQDNECTITGITAGVNQIEVRCAGSEQPATTIDLLAMTVTDPAVEAANGTPTETPGVAAEGKTLFKLDGAAMAELGGEWKRTEAKTENGVTFMRWESSPQFMYYTNADKLPFGENPRAKVRVRLKNFTDTYIMIRLYGTGQLNYDNILNLSLPDADGWRTAEGTLRSPVATLREFEIKPGGVLDPKLEMDVDSVEFISTAAATAAVPASVAPVVPVAPVAPVGSVGAGGGVLLFRLEGTVQEKVGRWARVAESTVDGRSILTWTDENAKHPPAFMTFQNPGKRVMPTKIRAKFSYRVNMAVGTVRMLFSTGSGEELIGTAPAGADEVGKWQEAEFTFSPKPGPKDELYFKLLNYPTGFAVDFDWVEIYDLTQAAPQPAPPVAGGGPAPAPQTVPNPAPLGPAPGTRVFGQAADSKKLTTTETKVIAGPDTTSSLALAGTSAKLFDGETSAGVFSITSTNPKGAGCWLMLDLGSECAIDGIRVYNFFNADRTYGQQVWQVSPFDDFLRNVVTVYNSDAANVHGQGAGSDPDSKATKDGTSAFFAPVRGRYVRLWFNGNNDNQDNHILEIEVFGNPSTAGVPVAANLAEGDLKINAGRGTIADWKTEGSYVSGGADQADAKPVALTKGSLVVPDKLYNSFRGAVQTWNFPKLPDGNYWIRLHFAEPAMSAAGQRIFDVVVNDKPAIKGYDIFAAAGGAHKAVVETVAAVAADGKGLKVELKMVKGAPILCGIEILPTAGPLPAPARLVAP